MITLEGVRKEGGKLESNKNRKTKLGNGIGGRGEEIRNASKPTAMRRCVELRGRQSGG